LAPELLLRRLGIELIDDYLWTSDSGPWSLDCRLNICDILLSELEPILLETTSELLGTYLIPPNPSSKVPSGLKITRGCSPSYTSKKAFGATR
jgi:hypothetical protein